MPAAFVNAVYYPSWGVYKSKPPSTLRLESVTHVLYAFISVNEDGSLRLLDEWGDLQKPVDGETGCLAALAKLKRQNPCIKTLISVGGGSASAEFPALARNDAARQIFVQQAREFCDKYDFDGIDIDWEHPTTPAHGQHFKELIRDVRGALPAPRYLVTTALPTGEYCLMNIDLKAVGENLDYLNLMGYDFTGGWTDVAGHHAQLYAPTEGTLLHASPELRKSCARGVDYVLSTGFPAEKIVLGIPAYARHFPRARAAGQPSHRTAGEADYCDLPDHWVTDADVEVSLGAASFVDDEKGLVSFDVPDTVVMKAQYANEMRLGGLFYWTGSGDREGAESLVDTGYRELMARFEAC